MTNGFKLFEIIPESTKEEALNPTSNLIGQAFRGIAHKVLDPLVRYNIVKDQEMSDFTEKIRKKTDLVPIENRDSSKLGLTLKAVEDSSYQLNEEILRDMFSNLITASVDNRINSLVRPSYSSILKDMSPKDASLFETIFKESQLPIVTVRIENSSSKIGVDIIKNVILLNDNQVHEAASLDTLHIFGLIEVTPESYLVAPKYVDQYDKYQKSAAYKEVVGKLPYNGGNNLVFDSVRLKKGKIELTSLGEGFGRVVIS